MRAIELGSGGLIVKIIRQQRRREAARTGLHVSSIVNDIAKTIAPAKYDRAMDENVMFSFQEMGNVIEDLIARELRRRLGWKKPEPRTFRGIIGSPDGWDERTKTLDEIKATWVNNKDFVTIDEDTKEVVDESLKWTIYMMQVMFYALAWNAQRVRLHVFFVRGDYGIPTPPRTFILKPTTKELERNYRVLAQHARDQKLEGYDNIPF